LPGQVMLDEAFTAENMKKALEQRFPLVHIASHFDFGVGNNTDSFLLLGGKGEQGERLTLADMQDPRFDFTDTQLLTLSACNTAISGAANNGREIDGLGYMAQRKGARAVVASLWGVYDSSTGVLMQSFYRNWTTGAPLSKAEALRRAQLALLHGDADHPASGGKLPYAHPYYWAPFILIGNWQ
jgi:CHAT domain-containing protein